ncbi:hypothetical protein SAMD00019534_059430 [Acytostelium subglobosum LB1]|uniref:hypothetical protein n=1 Tax=Acytostelium subglobosum LB1 TaxID=1410327 RepID=UPI000644A3FD|nr:hypothetical protein SAMD00019534_059430 [Acytostelium subglobosum LB1]GAM22768.1 hypothetical protein SAMD00019534_059430 [Acytostelium subglobosum LB1]|eukprot:XP_012753995.1 hypothetical protein SAMD00019534_059430 [Acytostelium subglobosum LB1]
MILYLIHKTLVFVVPIVALLVASVFDYYIAARLSILLVTHRILLLGATALFPTLWDTFWFVVELPLLIALLSCYYLLPRYLIDSYLVLLDWTGPALIIVEAIQSINFIVFVNRALMNKTMDPSYDLPIKVLSVIASLVSYLVGIFIFYQLFTNESTLTFVNVGFLSSTITLLVILIPFMVVVEDSMLLDIALITLFVALQCFSNLFGSVATSSGYQYILKIMSICSSTIILVSLPMIYGRSSSFSQSTAFGDLDESDYKESIYQLVQMVIIIALTYLPLTYFGHISTVSKLLQYSQIVIQISLYVITCINNTKEHIN